MNLQRTQLHLLVGVFCAMAVLEVSFARRQCLWVDEVFSLAMATGHSLEQSPAASRPEKGDFVQPLTTTTAAALQGYVQNSSRAGGPARVLRAVLLSDTSPPLYYLLLYCWIAIFGTGDFVLRLFSILWSLATFPILIALARRVGGEKSVVPVGILYAFSPLGLYFSGEGRMYSLFLFFIVAAAWVTLVIQERERRIGWYLLWISLCAFGLLTHYFFFLPLTAIVLYLWLTPRFFKRRHLLMCLGAVGIAIVPWYWAAFSASGQWRVTQGWLSVHPTGYRRMRGVRNNILQFFSPGSFGVTNFRGWSSLGSLLGFAVVFGALFWRRSLEIFKGPRLLPWLWFGIAAITPSVLDLVLGTYFTNNPRYSFPALPAAYLLAGMGFAVFGTRMATTILLLIVVSWGLALKAMFGLNSRSNEPYRAVAEEIARQAQPDDLVLVHSIPSGAIALARYLPPQTPMVVWVEQLSDGRNPESLAALINGRKRILYVLAHFLGEATPDEKWLKNHARTESERWRQTIKFSIFRSDSANQL